MSQQEGSGYETPSWLGPFCVCLHGVSVPMGVIRFPTTFKDMQVRSAGDSRFDHICVNVNSFLSLVVSSSTMIFLYVVNSL